MTIRSLLLFTFIVAVILACAMSAWAIAVFLASIIGLVLTARIDGKHQTRSRLKIGLLILITATVYVLSFGPAVALDQTIYNGNKLNGEPYGSVQLIKVAYPIQTEIRNWPYFGDDPRSTTRRLLESYDSQWRYVGSSARVFLNGFAAELARLCGMDLTDNNRMHAESPSDGF